jgi:flavin-dependent dehydrogenase
MLGSVRLRSAGPSRVERAGGPGWIAVGDAAAAHDPLSADGITKALIGGMEAARIFAEGESAPLEYARAVVDSFDRHMEERCLYYRWETRWPDSKFWQRRHGGPSTAMV